MKQWSKKKLLKKLIELTGTEENLDAFNELLVTLHLNRFNVYNLTKLFEEFSLHSFVGTRIRAKCVSLGIENEEQLVNNMSCVLSVLQDANWDFEEDYYVLCRMRLMGVA